jgi:hypothetical protein
MYNRLQNNKVFQAALARSRANHERLRHAQSPSNAAASSSSEVARIGASPLPIQRTKRPQVSQESSVPQSNTPISRLQNISTPQSRPLASAPSASSPSLAHDLSPGEGIAKRQRIHEIATTESPAQLVAKAQVTPSTQMRPSDMHTRLPHAHPASPPARPSVAGPAACTASHSSPPTPTRHVPRAATASTLFSKSTMPLHQPPVKIVQTYANRNFFQSKPSAFFRSSYASSLPPLNEPTPICTMASSQRLFSFQVSAGFQNDGNTCYLRYCSCACA